MHRPLQSLLGALGRRHRVHGEVATAVSSCGIRWTSRHAALSTEALSSPAHNEVVIAIGSNQGNRVHHVLSSIGMLPQYGIEVLRMSLLYETAPAYVSEQPPYLNAAVLGRTDLLPLQLLYALKQIEKAAGRDLQSGLRWGPRPLDLDIVFFGAGSVAHESLTVPHCRWGERAFVQAPVVDLLLPEDEQRGFVVEGGPSASVLPRLQEAALTWAASGGEAQVGTRELCRVLPVQRQLWRLGEQTRIMGILNVTPDSFSDGRRLVGAGGASVRAAVEAARTLARAGAAIIDVGGQSTRPGAARVPEDEEARRVLPVIRALRDDSELVHVPVSVDTFYASVAGQAVAAGADMVNDVSGGLLDSGMLPLLGQLGVPYAAMHMRGDPSNMQSAANTRYGCVWQEVGQALHERAAAALQAGVLPWNLVLDPGLGFSKSRAGSAELLGRLRDMRERALPGMYGRMPVLVGPSRKGFLGAITGHKRPEDRDVATVASCVVAVAQGADLVRVHNVGLVADGVRVADCVLRHDYDGLDDAAT